MLNGNPGPFFPPCSTEKTGFFLPKSCNIFMEKR